MLATQEIIPSQNPIHDEDILLHGEANSAAIDVTTGTYPGEEVCTVSSSPGQSYIVIKNGDGLVVVNAAKKPEDRGSYQILGENQSIDIAIDGEFARDGAQERLFRISNTVIKIALDDHKINKRLLTVVANPEAIVHVQADRDQLVRK